MTLLAARRLVEPDYWTCPHGERQRPESVLTYGPEVAEVNASAGFPPDEQQQLGLDLIFAIQPDGLPASFSFCVICCRQNLKTGLLKQAAIGWLAVTEERRIVWSAHEMDTTREVHGEIADLIKDTPALSRLLPITPNNGIYDANGQERIERRTGQTLRFKARTLSGSRGLTGDKTILDEAFALKPAHVGSLLPTMMARPHGQVLYASSAGKSDSDVLRDVRDRGRAGTSPRLSYIEWLAPRKKCELEYCDHAKDGSAPGCALDDEELWRKANPTIATGRITLQTVADMRQELPPAEFARECLGWWDESGPSSTNQIYGEGRWGACAFTGDDGDLQDVMDQIAAPPAIGVAVSLDREWASIAAAATVEVLDDPDDPEAEPVDRSFVAPVDRRAGVGWLVSEVKRIQDQTDCAVVIDKGGPAKDLIKDFEDADVAIEAVTLDEYAEGSSRVYDKVRDRRLLHPGATELDAAVDAAVWRIVTDRRVPGRRQSTDDISMLEAAILADLGAEKFGDTFHIY